MTPPRMMTFYGDDFTGSTDVMEALVRAGVDTVLFVDPPTPEQLANYPQAQAIGVAGMSRTMSPAQMEQHLPGVFAALRAIPAPLAHYKVCSTFDSSPTVGSIGCAMEIGREAFSSSWVPLVVGAPVLGRYCVFGNVFARSGLDSEPFRLDRHPTMSRHPVTPMNEADLRRHLAPQTPWRVDLFDALKLECNHRAAVLENLLATGPDSVLFDTFNEAHLASVGGLVWSHASREKPLFAVGSSGLEYALGAHWAQAGLVQPLEVRPAEPVDQLLVGSGSASPVTAAQIERALSQGFSEVRVDTAALVGADATAGQAEVEQAAALLAQGRSVVMHLACGPDDPRIAQTRQRIGDGDAGDLGRALGSMLRGVLERHPLSRVAVTGGDTSGHVARELHIESLRMLAPLTPGGPLCVAQSTHACSQGLEIVFKGGQVGWPDFFESVKKGRKD